MTYPSRQERKMWIEDPVGNNAASLQRLSDPLYQSYERTLLEYIHSQENF